MGELSLFSYRPRSAWIYSCDARLKLAALVGLSICSLGAGWIGLGLVFLAVCLVLLKIVPSPLVLWRQNRFFMILLSGVILARGLLTSGQILVDLGPMELSREGLTEGTLIAWRLMLIVMLSMILTASTRTGQLRSAVAWYLRPVVFVDEKKAATMIGLLVRFIPVILGQVRETAAAQQARAVGANKNPLKRTFRLVLPVVRRVFLTADRLVFAMESRCFSFDRPLTPLKLSRKDWPLATGAVILCAVLLLG